VDAKKDAAEGNFFFLRSPPGAAETKEHHIRKEGDLAIQISIYAKNLQMSGKIAPARKAVNILKRHQRAK
jgi:NTP pyrophosphatase (non-canonical NTP hydrolase)